MEAVREVVDAIRNQRLDEVGNVCEWPADLVQAGDWSPVQWFDPKLAEAAARIRSASGLRRLNDVYAMGPAGQRIHDAFERVTDESSTASDVAVFDSISSDIRVSLAGEPDAMWRPKPGKASMVRSYLGQRGWMMLMSRADTHAASVVGVFTSTKCFGSGLMPVITETPDQAKALCLIWNSTPVLLQLLNMRSRKLTYPKWSVAQLGSVRIPEELNDGERQATLIATYDRLCHSRLQRWAHADTDPVRREIDEAVAEAYGISAGALEDWRQRLAREPSVTNRNPI